MNTPLQMTHHAEHRRTQRTAPDCVLELLRTGSGTDFLGRHPNHPRVQLRIVRTADSYWVAPHAKGIILTVYEKEAREIDGWAWRHLHHPEQNRHRLRRLPVHHTPLQSITADLYALLGHGSVNTGIDWSRQSSELAPTVSSSTRGKHQAKLLEAWDDFFGDQD
ncbi:MAG: hypothetical protein H0X64_11370 [Gemmatimonadaceae bacterium]|nr:hypothetical protein [Gemmatimonadaceae bacterium]